MLKVRLDFLENGGPVVATIEEGKNVRFLPITVTHTSPNTKIPLLGEDPSGELPQSLLDTLFEMALKGDVNETWWHDYYICRRTDQDKYAEQIADADIQFAIDTHDAEKALKSLSV